MQRIANYIDGELIPPRSSRYLENLEPATGLGYSEVPDSDASDIDRAVDAAEKAFSAWAEAPLDERARLLHQIAELIKERAEAFAHAEAVDSGKPLSAARQVDIPRAAANFEFFSSAIQHFFSESHATGTQALNYTLRAPLGVVGCISPWNLPLYLFTWKVAPALAAGNTVVAKPSELTPMTAYHLSEICQEAKLPPGVLNIVHGTGAKVGQSLVEQPKVQAISFTGGTQTGARIAATAAPRFKKLSLELGGKNPNIVFADCDFERAVATSVRSSFFNQGEICLSGSRIFIERSIFDKFRDEFVRRTQALRVADPLVEGCDVGAIISENHLHKVLSYIGLGREEGGQILTGGRQVHLEGRCEGGVFRRADNPRGPFSLLPGQSGRDFRSSGDPDAIRPRGRGGRICQRHAVRPFRHDLERKHQALSSSGEPSPIRRDLDQLLAASGSSDTLRRHEAIGGGPRGRL